VLLIAAGAGIILLALIVAGVNPLSAGQTLFHTTLGSANGFSETLKQTTPLLIAGIAVYLALQAGLFNIGVEGQLLMGALACAYVGLKIPGPLGVVLGILAAMVVGSLWALPAALIKAYRNGHEVITTIMLNNIALFITTAIVAGPLKDPGQQSPTTALLSDSTRLPWLYSSLTMQLSSGILIGLAVLFGFRFWLKRTVAGYELRAVGFNPRAAKLAGVSTTRVILWSMAASGAIGGLAGAVQVLGYEGRFYSDFSPGYGFNALGVALVSGSNPVGIIPAALLFGILNHGSAALQIQGVPHGTSYVILGIVIIVFAALRYRRLTSEVAA
jgi:simple sugar transport system permease protein